MSAEFLLEVGLEEVPAWMIEPALADLRRGLEEILGAVEIRTYATPRRLVGYVPALPEKQPDKEEQVTGPPKSAPPKAAESFAAKHGVSEDKLQTVTTPKGEYWAVVKREEGQKTETLLSQKVPEIILGIHWPKTMYWADKNIRFIRPIRSLLALFGGRVVPVSLASVKSGNTTFGHRNLGKPKIKVTSFENYVRKLRENGVILDGAERRKKIETEASALLPENCRLRPNPELLNTLAYLTELPAAELGFFDESYLELPEEVLVTVMQHHQKYLSVEQADGRLAPQFVFVMNLDGDSTGVIRHGHERVLRARFNDARFFWETDQKLSLEARAALLKKVTFQAQLGSYGQKVQNMVELARALAGDFGADPEAAARAAALCKCDLTTELVKEFTELQGIVGGLYARAQGEPEKVALAIYDHYKPESMEDSSPRTPEGAVVSVADKIDTLAGCFSVGLIPSGSKDPFALRRAAQGVVKILTDHASQISFGRLVFEAWKQRPDLRRSELFSFLRERLIYYLREIRGYAYDEVNAVLWRGGEDEELSVSDAVLRCEAVRRIRPTENFEPLAVAFKRIKNILRQAGGAERFGEEPEEGLLETGAESDLYAEARRIFAETSAGKDYESILRRTADLRPFVDTYFDKVLVMANDERVRQNRLTLLAWLLRAFTRVADFSEIVVGEGQEAGSA